jgi:hypothetical protein
VIHPEYLQKIIVLMIGSTGARLKRVCPVLFGVFKVFYRVTREIGVPQCSARGVELSSNAPS